ncbi:MAG: hypothetical protein IJ191_06080, partial [Treponema sp.]|nr:hypothetical protein [Treponema sp.]
MKRLAIAIFTLVALILPIISCMDMIHPRQYYYQHINTKQARPPSTIEREDVPEISAPNEATDPFKIGVWNSSAYKFDGTKIKDWFFCVNFDEHTVPTYQFKQDADHNPWTDGNREKNEKLSKSPNGENKAQGYDISDTTVYRYDGKNPLIKPSAPYNAADGRMARFYFYRIKGTAAIVALDQHLIAVDSYSKFIFAYGTITNTSSVAGNPVPTSFEALDAYAAPAGKTRGEKLAFYQYDPIGFIKGDGTVVLYEEYCREMGNEHTGRTKYFPQVHDMQREIAQHENTHTSGRSPYFSLEDVGAPPSHPFLDGVAGKTYYMRQSATIWYETKSNGMQSKTGNDAVLHSWQFDGTGKTLVLQKIDTHNNTTMITTETYTYDETQVKKDDEAVYKTGD